MKSKKMMALVTAAAMAFGLAGCGGGNTAATTAAPATTVAPKKTGSPKTGSAGVAVAVAGLVTAGATAVVLKKKH